jgi:hypothetical protein
MEKLTWGLDVSTDKNKTAAVALDWSTPGKARVVDVHRPLRAVDVAPLIAKHRDSRWAVDVPFGWPDLFVELMADRHKGAAACGGDADRGGLEAVADSAGRTTAHRPVPHRRPANQDPSPSGVVPTARRHRRNVGVGRGALGLPRGRDRPSRSRRRRVRDLSVGGLAAWGYGKAKQPWSTLQTNFPFLTAEDNLHSQFASDDVCDAVVCALVARARDLDLTIGPPDGQVAAGRREGWIHVSCEPSDLLASRA